MKIKKFARQNAALVAGISLPIVVVIFFLLATSIPRWLVDPPQYDFLFVRNHAYPTARSQLRHEIDVDENHHLRVRAFLKSKNQYVPSVGLFLFEHQTRDVREISLPIAEIEEADETGVVVEVAALKDWFIDTHRIAPDGYEVIDPGSNRYGLLGLFSGRSRRSLSYGKSGAVFPLPPSLDRGAYGPRFLGWIITPPNE